MDADAIYGAIRGVITGALGSVRTVPAGTFVEGLPSSIQADGARWLRAKAKRSFDVEIPPAARSRDLGPSTASRALLDLEVLVTLTYALSVVPETESKDYRFAARAQAIEDALAISQALTWPGNLVTDESANATGLVGQALLSELGTRVKREDWTAGLYELELRFAGKVLETQAVA